MSDTTHANRPGLSPAALIEQIESRMAAVSELFNEMEALRARNDQHAAELAQREAQIARRAQELERTAGELAQASMQARKQEEAAQLELQAARQRLAELERQGAGIAGGAVRQLQDVVGAVRQLEQMQARDVRIAELEQESAALGQMRASLESSLREAHGAIDELRAERETISGRVQEMESALREVHTRFEDAQRSLEASQRHADEVEAARAKIEQELQTARARNDELKAETRGALRHVSELESSLEAANQRVEQLQAHAGDGQERIAALESQIAEMTQAREDTAAQIDNLQAELADARRAAADAEERAVAAKASSRRADDQRLSVRKARLVRARRLLRERSEQLNRAVRAVEAKYRECEQILQAREHVAAASRAIQRAEKQVREKAARTKAANFIAAALGVLALIFVGSWLIAGYFATPTYLARIELVPEVRGRDMTEEQTVAWRVYHESLLRDPLVTQAAAERMGRRGITTLADPGALRERLAASLRVETPTPGRLILELDGQGHERTRRILETYAAAIVSHANASRERRPDGASTAIAVEAAIVGEPLNDNRPVIAAGLSGGLSLAAIFGWVALWSRLRKPDASTVEEAAMDVEQVAT